MRKCIRCGFQMVENCSVKVEGAGYGMVMATDDRRIFSNRMGKPRVAICPECGEISFYIENVDQLKG